MTNEEKIIVLTLAATDAVWLPVRIFRANRGPATYAARLKYQTSGVPYSSRATDAAGRKAAERSLKQLEDDGLIVVVRPTGTKATAVKLTDGGDARARALVGLPGLGEALALVIDVAALMKGRPKKLADRWIAEPKLAGKKWGAKGAAADFTAVENRALPALMRGWLQSNASVRGHVYYTATDAGRAAIAGPRTPSLPPAMDGDAAALYLAQVAEGLSQLGSSVVKHKDIGPIPLPVAIDDVPI